MAWVSGEQPARSWVQALMDSAESRQIDLTMSMVNAGEVYYRLARQRGQHYARTFWDDFQTGPTRLVEAPNWLILEAAQWKSQHPISYADAFAVATARWERGALVTGDPDFKPLAEAGIVELEWIGG
ncbi:MAG: type II toxin-antitoxin system VapC family toxin [Acidobacteria bacterium]|nr:type II toxin-antitoxin system VapC family toxin [Acidobacteriota bacterium]